MNSTSHQWQFSLNFNYDLGSFRLSDSSSVSSRLSDASMVMPNETTLNSESKLQRPADRASFSVKKRSLPILMEDVHQTLKIDTDVETEFKQDVK